LTRGRPPPPAAFALFIDRIVLSVENVLVNLNDARRIAMSLPEVTEEPHFEYTSFRVKGRIFATAPPDGAHLHIFVSDEDREPALFMEPEVIEKLLWGGKVCGLRVALRRAKMPMVARLLKKAWLRRAPKALAATVRASERA
jgi:hypothetical protein